MGALGWFSFNFGVNAAYVCFFILWTDCQRWVKFSWSNHTKYCYYHLFITFIHVLFHSSLPSELKSHGTSWSKTHFKHHDVFSNCSPDKSIEFENARVSVCVCVKVKYWYFIEQAIHINVMCTLSMERIHDSCLISLYIEKISMRKLRRRRQQQKSQVQLFLYMKIFIIHTSKTKLSRAKQFIDELNI